VAAFPQELALHKQASTPVLPAWELELSGHALHSYTAGLLLAAAVFKFQYVLAGQLHFF
jgi:hypothetical protein